VERTQVESSKASGPVEKKIFSSCVEDNFFVLCVILDLDDKGEGAADGTFLYSLI